MKAILLSVRPEWYVKILNGEKTIEVRKLFPKDYVGWIYMYCSKGNKKDWHLIEVVDPDTNWEGYEYDYYIGSKGYLDWCLEGKIVARFWCDKAETINYVFERYCFGEWSEEYLQEKSCLTAEQLHNYLKAKTNDRNVGVAIHISKLEIFDRPKELSEFRVKDKYIEWHYNPDGIGEEVHFEGTKPLTKAPQNYCYVEGE